MLKNESKILNEFFMKDLTKLIEKYNKIDEVIVEKLEDLVAKVDDNEIKEILMKDLDMILALVDELGDEVDNDVIQLYFFIKNNIKEINIIEAKSIYEEIAFRGYSKLDDIIMYSKLKDLREYVSDEIDEIAKEMMDNYDEYEEVLDIESKTIFESKCGQAYYYVYVNN